MNRNEECNNYNKMTDMVYDLCTLAGNTPEAIETRDRIMNSLTVNYSQPLMKYLDLEAKYNILSLEYLEKCIQQYNALQEANPTEALKAFDEFNDISLENFVVINTDRQRLNTIKQALLKAQENEKVLEIIKEKNVDILAIKESKTLEEYNRNAWEVEHYGKFKGYRLQLTEEEFDLLKRYFK